MIKNIEILESAFQDIEGICRFIMQDNKSAAMKLFDEISEEINTLNVFPFRGSLVDEQDVAVKDFRYIAVKNYLVFYRIVGDKIVVYHVIDGRRDYKKLLQGV